MKEKWKSSLSSSSSSSTSSTANPHCHQQPTSASFPTILITMPVPLVSTLKSTTRQSPLPRGTLADPSLSRHRIRPATPATYLSLIRRAPLLTVSNASPTTPTPTSTSTPAPGKPSQPSVTCSLTQLCRTEPGSGRLPVHPTYATWASTCRLTTAVRRSQTKENA